MLSSVLKVKKNMLAFRKELPLIRRALLGLSRLSRRLRLALFATLFYSPASYATFLPSLITPELKAHNFFSSPLASQEPLYLAHQAGSSLLGTGKSLINALVQSVYYASLAMGAQTPILYGTLRSQGGQPSYEPQPQDKLILDYNGTVLHFWVQQFIGSNYQSPEAFLGANYSLQFQCQQPQTENELKLVVQKWQGQLQGLLVGKLSYEQTLFTIDLQLNSHIFHENDRTGAHTKITEDTQGTVLWPDAHLSLHEQSFFEMVSTTGTQSGSAQHDYKLRNNQLQFKGDRFEWQQVLVQKNYKNGKPSSPEAWVARGTVTKNGQAFGAYFLDGKPIGDSGGFIHVKMKTLMGEQTFESWPAY